MGGLDDNEGIRHFGLPIRTAGGAARYGKPSLWGPRGILFAELVYLMFGDDAAPVFGLCASSVRGRTDILFTALLDKDGVPVFGFFKPGFRGRPGRLFAEPLPELEEITSKSNVSPSLLVKATPFSFAFPLDLVGVRNTSIPPTSEPDVISTIFTESPVKKTGVSTATFFLCCLFVTFGDCSNICPSEIGD